MKLSISCQLLTLGLGFFVIFSLVNLPFHTFAQTTDQDFITFGKSIFGISIKHPVNWVVQEFDRNVRDDRIGFDLMAILCPKSIAEYPYPDFVQCPLNNDLSVATAKLPKNSTLEEYVAYLDKTNKFAYTDYKKENMSNGTMANLPAKELLYTYMDDYQGEDEIIKVLDIIASSGNRTYEIKFTAPQFQFDDLNPTVSKMIDSINILPMPPCNFVRENASLSEGKCTLKSSLGQ